MKERENINVYWLLVCELNTMIVLSLGGSMINRQEGIDHAFLAEMKRIIGQSNEKFGIVTGGGFAAREYAKKAKKKGASEFEADEAAIKGTWENAKTTIKALGKMASPTLFKDFNKAKAAMKKYKVVVMGGTIPGITTDTDSVLLAECIGAKRLINISNVDAVYDSDPRTNPNAKKFLKMTHDELIMLAVGSDKRTAGTNFIFDMLACKLASRSSIEINFVSGKNLEEVKKAINHQKYDGTVVTRS